MTIRFAALFFCINLFFSAHAAEKNGSLDGTQVHGEEGATFLPALYYTPDTSIALGGSVIYFQRENAQEKWKTSTVQSALVYTLNRQWIAQFSPDLYLNQGKILLRGFFLYLIYPDYYYGVGTSAPIDFSESYTSESIRFRLNPSVWIQEKTWLGLSWEWNSTQWSQLKENGLVAGLATQIGKRHHFSGLGFTLRQDHRNQVFYPTQGHFLEAQVQLFDPKLLFNDFRFWKCSVDWRKYFSLGEQSVFGVQGVFQGSGGGEKPFYQLPAIGGQRSLRGYREGRYRGDFSLFFQGEYRRQLTEKLGGVLFSGIGTIFGPKEDYQRIFPAVGAGVRYLLEPLERINARFDVGYWPGNFGFYILIGESF